MSIWLTRQVPPSRLRTVSAASSRVQMSGAPPARIRTCLYISLKPYCVAAPSQHETIHFCLCATTVTALYYILFHSFGLFSFPSIAQSIEQSTCRRSSLAWCIETAGVNYMRSPTVEHFGNTRLALILETACRSPSTRRVKRQGVIAKTQMADWH